MDTDDDDDAQSCSEVLECEIYKLMALGTEYGMTEDEIYQVLEKILEDRSNSKRRKFRII